MAPLTKSIVILTVLDCGLRMTDVWVRWGWIEVNVEWGNESEDVPPATALAPLFILHQLLLACHKLLPLMGWTCLPMFRIAYEQILLPREQSTLFAHIPETATC